MAKLSPARRADQPVLWRRRAAPCRLPTVALLIALCGTAVASQEPSLRLTDDAIEGSSVPAGGEALIVGVAHESLPFQPRRATYAEIVTDVDRDGTVMLEPANGVAEASVWAVVDLESGKWSIAAPEASPTREQRQQGAITPDGRGSLRRFTQRAESLEIFIARPGVGAWRGIVADGGPDDRGEPSDGTIVADLGSVRPIGDTQKFDELREGDVVLAFDPQRLEFQAARVRGRRLSHPVKGGE